MQIEQNETESDNFPVSPLDEKLAMLLIETPAATDQELAEKLGISRQTVNRRKNSPIVQRVLRSMYRISEKEMRRLTLKALNRMEELLDHEDPRIKLAATIALVKLNERFIANDLGIGVW